MLGLRYPTELNLIGALRALIPYLEYKKDRSWRKKIESNVRDWWKLVEERAMGVATALSAFFSGVESLYSHYKNNFTYRIEWTPILLTPAIIVAGIGTVWSRTIARTLLPVTSILALLSGALGFFYHARGILHRPGGTKLPWYNLIYGPPIFAPLLFAATGFLGLLASFLRRAD